MAAVFVWSFFYAFSQTEDKKSSHWVPILFPEQKYYEWRSPNDAGLANAPIRHEKNVFARPNLCITVQKEFDD